MTIRGTTIPHEIHNIEGDQKLASDRTDARRLDDYQVFCVKTDRLRSAFCRAADMGSLVLDLFTEVGRLVANLVLHDKSLLLSKPVLSLSLGNMLWYLALIGDRLNLKLSGVPADDDHLGDAFGNTPPRSMLEQADSSALRNRALELGSRTGKLLDLVKGGHELTPHLLPVFQAILSLARTSGISIDQALEENARHQASRWPAERLHGPRFDLDADSYEQLPPEITMVFKQRVIAGTKYVSQSWNGVNIGDSLTDNRAVEDDYRFHDAFHLSYYALLGWSPVLRLLLGLSRKSHPAVAEAQDGLRAILIEEALSVLIFNQAKTLQHFEHTSTLDDSLLDTVHSIVLGYEVETRQAWEWEEAILQGYAAFRALRKNAGGVIVASLARHSISYHPAS